MYNPSEYEMKMFREMEGKYVSENERKFFETMLRKIQTEYASHTETIIDDNENPDGIYLYRDTYDLFYVGREDNVIEFYGLCFMLNDDLSEYNLFPGHKTLLEWLRSTDYRYVHYDNWEG